MTKEQLAAEALRIKENEAAQAILKGIRQSALEALSNTDPTNADTIRVHQATVRVVDDFFGALDAFVGDGAPKRKPGLV